jgi:hypothetical protein
MTVENRRLRATTDLLGLRDAERLSRIPRHRLIDAFVRGVIPRAYVDGRMKVTLADLRDLQLGVAR